MKRIFMQVILFSSIFIVVLSIASYEYVFESYIVQGYEAIEVIKPQGMNDSKFKGIIINNEFADSIIFKQRNIKEGKNIYNIYASNVKKLSSIGLFSTANYYVLNQMPASSISNNQMYIKKDLASNYIEFLEGNNIEVVDLGKVINKHFITFDIIYILFIFILVNILVTYFYITKNFKKYSLLKLEGLKNRTILKREILTLIKVSIIIFITITILLFIIYGLNFKIIWIFLINYLIYLIFILISLTFIYNIYFKDYFITYIKSEYIHKSYGLLILKFAILLLAISITSETIQNIDNIRNTKETIQQYEKYDDYVITEVYSPLQGSFLDDDTIFEEALYQYYLLTHDKFKGVLYEVDTANKFIYVNDNGLDYLNIKTKSGEPITSQNYPENQATHFKIKEEKSDVDLEKFNNENVVYIQDGFSFIEYSFDELSTSKKSGGYDVYYYPDNVQGIAKSNLVATITRGGYFLKTNSEDSYSLLKPYITEAGAQNYIISTPHVTNAKEKQLSVQIENTIYSIVKFILLLYVILIVFFVFIKNYMTIHLKKIVVNELEGRRKYIQEITVYNVIIYSVLAFINILWSYHLLIFILGIFIVEELLLYFVSNKYLKEKRKSILKGDL